MANFDLDDPLGDLLSDGSNDSFFEEPKKRQNKTPDKKSAKDLFGLEDQVEKIESKGDDWLGLDTNKKKDVTSVRRDKPDRVDKVDKVDRPIKKISFEEDDDILGFETPKKRVDHSKKTSIMESLLGGAKDEEKKFLSLDDLLKDSKSKKSEPLDVSQSTSHLNKAETSFNLLDAPRERRRQRAPLADPLGLFDTGDEVNEDKRNAPVVQQIFPSGSGKITLKDSPKVTLKDTLKGTLKGTLKDPKGTPKDTPKVTPKNTPVKVKAVQKEEEVSKTRSTPNIGDVPDWLGGSGMKPHKSETTFERKSSFKEEQVDTLMTQQKLAASHIEYQNNSIALQQQESQLLMALQLKKYEESLADMQRSQQDILVKQEQTFSNLLERQFAKQQTMENNMRLQQERINNHLQMLIMQPPVSPASRNLEDEKLEKVTEETAKHYEELLTGMKQRQHDEMFLLEESYKKQISTLEQSMESVENHLKTELDQLTHKHREKLNVLETEQASESGKLKRKIEELHLQHEEEMRQMRENNNRVIDEIKYEYNTIIENIKMSKQNEMGLLSEGGSYGEKLDASLKLLDVNSRTLFEMKNKVDNDYGVLSIAREQSLKAKEEEIRLMRVALDNAREKADTERSELMSLVRSLEIKLAEQGQNSREERHALQQAAAMLTARASALDREAEFNRSSLEREREQLKTLRESILAEQEKRLQEITEEKLRLHSERVRHETTAKLAQSYDAQRAKAETEAAIQVAREAAQLTDRERENLLRQVGEVETLKRNLTDRERKVGSREKELDAALDLANRKSSAGDRALEEARALQMNYNDRLREIQARMSSLNLRERKLAEEKVHVSRERLALQTNARQAKKCSLCAIDTVPKIDEEDDRSRSSEPVEQDIPRFVSLQMSEDQLTQIHNEDRMSVN